jgi:hypothetical protein
MRVPVRAVPESNEPGQPREQGSSRRHVKESPNNAADEATGSLVVAGVTTVRAHRPGGRPFFFTGWMITS